MTLPSECLPYSMHIHLSYRTSFDTVFNKYEVDILIGLLIYCYRYSKWKHNLFSKLGIPGPKPKFIFGILPCYKKDGLAWTDLQLVSTYGKVIGIYHGHNPAMLVADHDMIKEICINRSDVFINRASAFDMCGVLGCAVALADDTHWKFLKNKLVPVFTKDRLEQICPTLTDCLDTMVENIKVSSEKGKSFDFTTHCSHLSMDILMKCIFGQTVNSAKDPENMLIKQAQSAWKAGTEGSIKLGGICALCPPMRKVLKYFKVSPCCTNIVDFFMQITRERMHQSESPIQANLLKFMTERSENDNNNLADKEERSLTEEEITANIIFFIMAGYDTTANALSFVAYNLATNIDCQERLIHEINKNIKTVDMCYDSIMELPYLDKVICETLRLFPPMLRFNRRASADVTVCGQHIPKDMDVSVPIFALHRDPTVWTDPHKFDPDRFSPEQVGSRPAYSYIPFGAGARHCFASKLAVFVIKLAIVHLLKHFRLQTAPETVVPLKLDKGGYARAESGIWLRVQAL
ncbi:cytochrome P450 3A24-like [Ylistrum balloti]|uniref:cytochrome P450 3A24-like n=1 Tax=Ylistrum balloti TaxID=509963 RepID=UPI002905F2F1|nr:cytochrome P450 3A24-like [Ylistrum balloti]